ncbi:SgcJ/EcaC family oxidoreductase [Actinomadura fulvescens]|uniref:SnoaL-like domain-containing protein n=1 Tax=Actinomadura fulvescens TaxID=46160 RepID=A0ABN3PSM2_9ACTN
MSALTSADQAGAAQTLRRIIAAWADNDADAFAAVCAEDATLVLPGDVYLKGRAAIRDFMAAGYQGPYKDSRVFGEPLDVKFVSDDVCVLVTQGGVLMPGETKVSDEQAIRATWVLSRQDAEWLITAYHNSNVNISS